jgi:hypothetical protein
MLIVRLSGLSIIRAEALVARIWRAVEEHDIAAPKLSVVPGAGGRLSIGLTFPTKKNKAATGGVLTALAPVRRRAPK